MQRTTLPEIGPAMSPYQMSSYQRQILEGAPRLVFYYTKGGRTGLIPDTVKARRWAVEKRGATHFSCFTIHRFNPEMKPDSYKMGDFYCVIRPKNNRNIGDSDVIDFIISILTFSFRLPDAAPCKLIYLGDQTVGMTIPASAFGAECGGEILPYLYKEFYKAMVSSAEYIQPGRFDIHYNERVDVENKRLFGDIHAVPFRVGEVKSTSFSSLIDIARTTRTAKDMKWNQTFDPDILVELKNEAGRIWHQQTSQSKCCISSKWPKLVPLSEVTSIASTGGSNNTASTRKCARKLQHWISMRDLSEFRRRDALRAVSGSELLNGRTGDGGGVADALEMLVAHGYIQECPFPPIGYASRRPSPWYEVNPNLSQALS